MRLGPNQVRGGCFGIEMKSGQGHTGPNTNQNRKNRNQKMDKQSMEMIASGPIVAAIYSEVRILGRPTEQGGRPPAPDTAIYDQYWRYHQTLIWPYEHAQKSCTSKYTKLGIYGSTG